MKQHMYRLIFLAIVILNGVSLFHSNAFGTLSSFPLPKVASSFVELLTENELASLKFDYIEKNIEKLSKQDIDLLFEDIKTQAQNNNLNEAIILQELKKQIEQKISFYRISKYKELAFSLGMGALGIGFGILTYMLYIKWHLAPQQEYDQIITNLKQMGVRVCKRKDPWFHNLHYLDLHTFYKLLPEQEKYVYQCWNRLVDLENQDNNNIIIGEIITGFFSLSACVLSGLGVLHWLFPTSNKSYKKFCFIRKRIIHRKPVRHLVRHSFSDDASYSSDESS